MKTTAIAIGAFALLLAAGCKNETTRVSSASAPDDAQTASVQATANPEELGEMGAKIRANPSDANKILAERGMTEESFEKAIRAVSSDPALSRRYAAAYNKTKS